MDAPDPVGAKGVTDPLVFVGRVLFFWGAKGGMPMRSQVACQQISALHK